MTRLRDQSGFLLFYVGKLLVACLPKQPFSEAQIDFIRSCVNDVGAESASDVKD